MAKTTYGTWLELRVLRDKDGHTLTSLAEAADMSLGYLSDLENGRRWPNARMTKKLATALKVPVSVLQRDPAAEDVPA